MSTLIMSPLTNKWNKKKKKKKKETQARVTVSQSYERHCLVLMNCVNTREPSCGDTLIIAARPCHATPSLYKPTYRATSFQEVTLQAYSAET